MDTMIERSGLQSNDGMNFLVSVSPNSTLISSGIHLTKPPTPTSSPPTNRKRSASTSSTEIVRRSLDLDIEEIANEIANIGQENHAETNRNNSDSRSTKAFNDLPTQPPIKKQSGQSEEKQTSTVNYPIPAASTPTDGPVVSDTRRQNEMSSGQRSRSKTVCRTQSLHETIVRKFGTTYSYFATGQSRMGLNSESVSQHRPNTTCGTKPVIIRPTKPPTSSSQQNGRNDSCLLPPPIDYNPFELSNFNAIDPLKNISMTSTAYSVDGQNDSPDSETNNSIPLSSYIPQAKSKPTNALGKDNLVQHFESISTRQSHVNRSGVIVPDADYNPGQFAHRNFIKKSPSVTELNSDQMLVDTTSNSSNNCQIDLHFETENKLSPQHERKSLPAPCLPNTSSKKPNSSSTIQAFQQVDSIGRNRFIRNRSGSLRRNVQVLPDKNLFKEKANSSECLVMAGGQSSNTAWQDTKKFTKNDSQENIMSDSNYTFIPRPPVSKKPSHPGGTDSEDNSEADASSAIKPVPTPSSGSVSENLGNRNPQNSTTSTGKHFPPRYRGSTIIINKVKPSLSYRSNIPSTPSVTINYENQTVRDLSPGSEEDTSDVDAEQTLPISLTIATPIDNSEKRSPPKIRHPMVAQITRQDGSSSSALLGTSPPKTVTWNLEHNVVHQKDSLHETTSHESSKCKKSHRTRYQHRHHRHHNHSETTSPLESVKLEANNCHDHKRSNSDITEEMQVTDRSTKQQSRSESSRIEVESILDRSSKLLQKHKDLLEKLKDGQLTTPSYKTSMLNYLQNHQQYVNEMIEFLSK